MKLRPVILIALIIVLPLAALTWTVLRLAENEQIVLQQRYRALMEDRLQDINASVSVVFEDMERELSSVAAIDNFDITKLRETNHNQPRLLQLFVLNPQGQLAYPNPSGELNASERMFLIQAAKMFTGQDLKEAVARAEQDTGDNRKLTTKRVTQVGLERISRHPAWQGYSRSTVRPVRLSKVRVSPS